ncbi:MAG: SGNH/GDSL hydrolase family protein, partial [Gordonia paraffinivorans]
MPSRAGTGPPAPSTTAGSGSPWAVSRWWCSETPGPRVWRHRRGLRGSPSWWGRELGTPTRVLGAGGTGYVTRGPSGTPDFPTRMRQLDVDPRVGLLIVQGGINDLARPDGVGRAAAQVVEAARVTYPEARVVVIGPIPPTPASTGALRPMSSEIARSLAGSGALYVSPIDEGWITTTSSRGFLDA